jgi:hypothetical protein
MQPIVAALDVVALLAAVISLDRKTVRGSDVAGGSNGGVENRWDLLQESRKRNAKGCF